MPHGSPQLSQYYNLSDAEKNQLATEARDFLVYAIQEGDLTDVKAFAQSLNEEKLLAFIEVYGPLPEAVSEIIALDNRHRVGILLQISDRTEEPRPSMRQWIEGFGLSTPDILINGRREVVRVLDRVNQSGRELEVNEIPAVESMAHNIPKAAAMKAVLPLAERYPTIAAQLFLNTGLTNASEKIMPDELAEMDFSVALNNLLEAAKTDSELAIKTCDMLTHEQLRLVTQHVDVPAFVESVISLASADYELASKLSRVNGVTLAQMNQLAGYMVELAKYSNVQIENDLGDLVINTFPLLHANHLPENLDKAESDLSELTQKLSLLEGTRLLGEELTEFYDVQAAEYKRRKAELAEQQSIQLSPLLLGQFSPAQLPNDDERLQPVDNYF